LHPNARMRALVRTHATSARMRAFGCKHARTHATSAHARIWTHVRSRTRLCKCVRKPQACAYTTSHHRSQPRHTRLDGRRCRVGKAATSVRQLGRFGRRSRGSQVRRDRSAKRVGPDENLWLHSDARPRKLRQARTHARRCRCVSV
jgi:hypothetical protein